MGGGYVQVVSLTVDGVELLDRNLPFDWGCINEPSLVRIVVRAMASGVEFTQCAIGGPEQSGAEGKEHCTSKLVSIDLIAANNAKLDHSLADIASQKALSAPKVPRAP